MSTIQWRLSEVKEDGDTEVEVVVVVDVKDVAVADVLEEKAMKEEEEEEEDRLKGLFL